MSTGFRPSPLFASLRLKTTLTEFPPSRRFAPLRPRILLTESKSKEFYARYLRSHRRFDVRRYREKPGHGGRIRGLRTSFDRHAGLCCTRIAGKSLQNL